MRQRGGDEVMRGWWRGLSLSSACPSCISSRLSEWRRRKGGRGETSRSQTGGVCFTVLTLHPGLKTGSSFIVLIENEAALIHPSIHPSKVPN